MTCMFCYVSFICEKVCISTPSLFKWPSWMIFLYLGERYRGDISSRALLWWGYSGCCDHRGWHQCLLCRTHWCNYQVPGSSYKLWRNGILFFHFICSLLDLSDDLFLWTKELLCISLMSKHCIHQVVNMEWGNFWSSHLPRTPYDISLDDETQNRNDQVSNLRKFHLIAS
jgi:hypothetical protein